MGKKNKDKKAQPAPESPVTLVQGKSQKLSGARSSDRGPDPGAVVSSVARRTDEDEENIVDYDEEDSVASQRSRGSSQDDRRSAEEGEEPEERELEPGEVLEDEDKPDPTPTLRRVRDEELASPPAGKKARRESGEEDLALLELVRERSFEELWELKKKAEERKAAASQQGSSQAPPAASLGSSGESAAALGLFLAQDAVQLPLPTVREEFPLPALQGGSPAFRTLGGRIPRKPVSPPTPSTEGEFTRIARLMAPRVQQSIGEHGRMDSAVGSGVPAPHSPLPLPSTLVAPAEPAARTGSVRGVQSDRVVVTTGQKLPEAITSKDVLDGPSAVRAFTRWNEYHQSLALQGRGVSGGDWPFSWQTAITEKARKHLDTVFPDQEEVDARSVPEAAIVLHRPGGRAIIHAWRTWDSDKMLQHIIKWVQDVFPSTASTRTAAPAYAGLEDRLQHAELEWYGDDIRPILHFNDTILTAVTDYAAERKQRAAEEPEMIRRFLRVVFRGESGDAVHTLPPRLRINRKVSPTVMVLGQEFLGMKPPIATWEQFRELLYQRARDYLEFVRYGQARAIRWGGPRQDYSEQQLVSGGRKAKGLMPTVSTPSAAAGEDGPVRVGSASACWRCGRPGHGTEQCPHRNHKHANTENRPWAQSTKGKEFARVNWSKLCLSKSLEELQEEHRRGGQHSTQSQGGQGGTQSGERRSDKSSSDRKKGQYVFAAISSESKQPLLNAIVLSPCRGWSKRIEVLVDTGAVDGSYIDEGLFKELQASGVAVSSTVGGKRLCSLLGEVQHCVDSVGDVNVILQFPGHNSTVSTVCDCCLPSHNGCQTQTCSRVVVTCERYIFLVSVYLGIWGISW